VLFLFYFSNTPPHAENVYWSTQHRHRHNVEEKSFLVRDGTSERLKWKKISWQKYFGEKVLIFLKL
jgi:hypothetical protein